MTEAITRLDLVREQIRVAAGSPLSRTQEEINFVGHAIECRINAENHKTFRPTPGTITGYHPPGGLGVRVDSGLYDGYRVPPYYDSLIAKLVVHGRNRNDCLMRLRRCLEEFVIGGVDTTIPLHMALVNGRQPFIGRDLRPYARTGIQPSCPLCPWPQAHGRKPGKSTGWIPSSEACCCRSMVFMCQAAKAPYSPEPVPYHWDRLSEQVITRAELSTTVAASTAGSIRKSSVLLCGTAPPWSGAQCRMLD